MSPEHDTPNSRETELLQQFYAQFLGRFWQSLSGMLGNTATAALFHAARQELPRNSPLFQNMRIGEQGVVLAQLCESTTHDISELTAGYLAFVESLQTLILDLTGGIVITKLTPLIEEFRHSMNTEDLENKEQ